MPFSSSEPSDPDLDDIDALDEDTLAMMDIDQWVENLRRTDRSLYNLMALEVWSIAKTMDTLTPGFWGQFMENRHKAMKEYIKHRKHPLSNPDQSPETSE